MELGQGAQRGSVQQSGRPRAHSSALRLRLILAAANQVAKAGYRGASLADIAIAAGLSKNQLLHYFSSKEALLLAGLEHAAREWRDGIERPAAMYPQGSEALRAAATGLAGWALCGAPWLACLVALRRDGASLPPALAEAAGALEQAITSALRRHLKSAIRAQEAAGAGSAAFDEAAPLEHRQASAEGRIRARQRGFAALALACGSAQLNAAGGNDDRLAPEQLTELLLSLLLG